MCLAFVVFAFVPPKAARVRRTCGHLGRHVAGGYQRSDLFAHVRLVAVAGYHVADKLAAPKPATLGTLGLRRIGRRGYALPIKSLFDAVHALTIYGDQLKDAPDRPRVFRLDLKGALLFGTDKAEAERRRVTGHDVAAPDVL